MHITICNHNEMWTKVSTVYPNIKDQYEVSSYGNIKNSKTNKYLQHVIEPRGYHCVNLSLINGGQKRFYVHDLVAKIYLTKPNGKIEVNHINGVKKCNYKENLEWITNVDNIHHAIINGLRDNLYGEKHHKNKYPEEFIRKICSLIEKGLSPRKILRELNIQCQGKEYSRYKRLIKHIKQKEQWVHKFTI